MKLIDFSVFAPLTRLRDAMGAEETVDLAPQGWEPIRTRGIDVENIEDIQTNDDRTLAYDGRRVLVYIRDQYLSRDGTKRGYRFHVAECKKIQEMRKKKRFGRYVATNRKDGRFLVNFLMRGAGIVEEEVEEELKVCKYCLGELQWESYHQARSARKKEIWNAFSPAGFFDHYESSVNLMPAHDEFNQPLNSYPPDWKERSERARDDAGWICRECRRDFGAPPFRRFLHTHHINGNRGDSGRANLKVVCIECHDDEPDHDLTGSPDIARLRRLVREGKFPPRR